MAENELYQAFLQAAGEQSSGLSDVRYALEEVIAQLGVVGQTTVQPVKAATTSQSKTSSSDGADSTLITVLKSGFGLGGLIGGLVGLFSGGGGEAPPALVKYALPAPVSFQAAEAGGQLTTADYDQTGRARSYPVTGAGTQGTSVAPQITVNVQAMDARSLMDRSGDIALAVRDAMLNLNSINDVVNDL